MATEERNNLPCVILEVGVHVLNAEMDFFIEKVRLYPCLWDMSHQSYRDIIRKDLAWDRISKECGMANGKEAKSQWKKLRDSHREAIRRRKSTTGQAAKNVKTWKYEVVMSFLLPQSVNGSTISNFSNNSQDNCSTSNNTTATNMTAEFQPPESPLTHEESSPSPLSPPESAFPPPGSANPYTGSPNPPLESTPDTTNTTKLGKTSQNRVLTSVTELLQNRDKRREQRQMERDDIRRKVLDTNRASQDALSNLFTSFCEKTRQLPKYLQLRVERQIFEIVARAEEEVLTFDSVNNYYSPTSSTSSYEYSSGTHHQTRPLPDNTRDTQHVYSSSRDVSEKTPPQASNTTPHEPQEESDSLPDISAAFTY